LYRRVGSGDQPLAEILAIQIGPTAVPRISGKGQPTAKDRFNQALNQPPGSPPPGSS
jgi:hypothetical protein